MKVAILGAAGAIGKATEQVLRERGVAVRVVGSGHPEARGLCRRGAGRRRRRHARGLRSRARRGRRGGLLAGRSGCRTRKRIRDLCADDGAVPRGGARGGRASARLDHQRVSLRAAADAAGRRGPRARDLLRQGRASQAPGGPRARGRLGTRRAAHAVGLRLPNFYGPDAGALALGDDLQGGAGRQEGRSARADRYAAGARRLHARRRAGRGRLDRSPRRPSDAPTTTPAPATTTFRDFATRIYRAVGAEPRFAGREPRPGQGDGAVLEGGAHARALRDDGRCNRRRSCWTTRACAGSCRAA